MNIKKIRVKIKYFRKNILPPITTKIGTIILWGLGIFLMLGMFKLIEYNFLSYLGCIALYFISQEVYTNVSRVRA